MPANDRLHQLIDDEALLERVEEIARSMSCPRDFVCVRSGLEALGKAHHIGGHSYLECLDDNPVGCRFSVACGQRRLCTCPMRTHIFKNYDK